MELAYKRDKLYSDIQKIAKKVVKKSEALEKVIECTFKKFAPALSLFDWKSNSCFLDVVVAIILYCKYSFWRDPIFQSPFSDPLSQGFYSISKYCQPLREKLVEKDPEMGFTTFYEAVTTFELIADHFNIRIPGWYTQDPIIYSSDEIVYRPPYLVYSPISKTEDGKTTYLQKKELEEYKLVAAIKNRGWHYTCFFESYEGIFYYDDTKGVSLVTLIPKDEYELEFYVLKK